MSEPKRWIATIYTKTNNGIVDNEYEIEELDEIADIVERGPHWDTIKLIRIERNPMDAPADLTVEEAAKL